MPNLKTDVDDEVKEDASEDAKEDASEAAKEDASEDDKEYVDDAIEDHIVSDAIKALSEDMKVLSETVGNLVAKVNSVAAAQDVMLSNGAVVHEEEDETPDLDAFGMDGISLDDLDLTL